VTYPFLQSMSEQAASEHIVVKPSSDFVRKRDNGSFACMHCWPVKYNEDFRKQFKVSKTNWDFSKFSPRKAHEFRQCMTRLFGELGDADLLYCVKSTNNPMKVLLGSSEQLVDFLRVRPALQAEMHIVKMHPDGFISKVLTKGKPDSEKQFRMKRDDGMYVVYVKKGYETMACCKPLSLFNKDCELVGEPIEIEAEIKSAASEIGIKARTAAGLAAAQLTA